MAVHQESRPTPGTQTPTNQATRTTPRHTAVMTPLATHTAAAVRITTGLVFLWAFLDKTFGWHYATGSGKGWTDGASPTKGFLSGVSAGPLQSAFHDIAGKGWTDTLFMLALLGLGLALTTGIALRPTALAGTALMALMWAAEWPPAQHLSTGAPTFSSNPLIDYHIIYAAVMILLATTHAGNTWGLGRTWAHIPLITRNPWLL